MTTDRLLEILEERELSVSLDETDDPILRGPAEEITPKLLAVFRLPVHRVAIRRRLLEERKASQS